MFREIISPILRSTRLCLQLTVQCTDDAAGRQHRRCIVCTVSCKHSAPEDGRNYLPKHVELIEIISKLLLLHLVGCLHYCMLLYFWLGTDSCIMSVNGLSNLSFFFCCEKRCWIRHLFHFFEVSDLPRFSRSVIPTGFSVHAVLVCLQDFLSSAAKFLTAKYKDWEKLDLCLSETTR